MATDCSQSSFDFQPLAGRQITARQHFRSAPPRCAWRSRVVLSLEREVLRLHPMRWRDAQAFSSSRGA